jgi:uncharacterized protein involved in exopolysaccharide biosynthesis
LFADREVGVESTRRGTDVKEVEVNAQTTETQPLEGRGQGSDALALENGREIKVLDLLVVIARRKALVAKFTLGVALLAALASLLQPSLYTATAKILPPQQSGSPANALLDQLGVTRVDLGYKDPKDIWVALLNSRTVAWAIVNRFDLRKLYREKRMADAESELRSRTEIVGGKDGLISVSVDDPDPDRAAKLANAYVEELQNMNRSLAVTEAGQRRKFFEGQLEEARAQLRQAEGDLVATQEKTGVIDLGAQSRGTIEMVARLRAQITGKEVQIRGMRAFATDQNPELVRNEAELGALRAQMATMENSPTPAADGSTFLPAGKVARSYIEYVRRFREVKYYESLVDYMYKAYISAKIDEAKDSIIEVVDPAVPPERKSKPKRGVIVVLALMVGFLISACWVMMDEMTGRAMNNPEHAWRVSQLKQELRNKTWW